jgi:hypothetical protein
MHPVMTEILAAERIREMVARGDDAQRARQARAARRARQARVAHRSGLDPALRPGTQPAVPRPRESQENHDRSSAPGRPGTGR